ncbi:MAG: response regulator transcription factor [Alphaproteobacteria bacterium]|jgi:DNA-binding response OmpR family regulator|nr:response regulator transcription factor [Alphaproteobacteria bacterium]|tara:strand:+ start:49 stop:756 length:708 start_codon:yes stop_codon:yes gene_type:complete
MAHQLLMIEDDAELAAMVGEYLGRAGMEVAHAATAAEGLARLTGEGFDAVVLDIMLPDLDGFETCRRIRGQSEIPILMLTARGEDTDRIVGLELGADDYLPKPFNPRELLARLRAILRRGARGNGAPVALLRFGRLTIDHGARRARIGTRDARLTGYQFDLLWALAENAGRVMSRDQLMDRLRGHGLEAFDRSIDVHVSRIRAAIEDDPKHPRRLITVRGAGYLLARRQDDDAES